MVDKLKSKRRIKKLLTDHKEWAASTAENIYDRGMKRIAEHLHAQDKFTSFKVLPVPLDFLATYYGTTGLCAKFNDANIDWKSIDLSIRYYELKLRYEVVGYFKRIEYGEPTRIDILYLVVRECAHLLATSILLDMTELQNFAFSTLKIIFYSDDALSHLDLRNCTYEPFMLLLYQKFSGFELSKKILKRDLDIYQPVIANWDNTDGWNEVISSLCDYHCEWMIDKGQREEFDIPPFDLYPVEILALYKVRKKLGLKTPIVDHPLLQTPLASFEPRTIAPIDDPILKQVAEFYNAFVSKPKG